MAGVLRKILYLLVAGIVIYMIGFNRQTTFKPLWNTYSNKTTGVSFSYPSTWKELGQDKLTTSVKPEIVFFDPNSQGAVGANVNLVINKSPFLVPSAKDQAAQTTSGFKNFGSTFGIKDYQQISYEDKDINGRKAGILVGESTISQNDARMKQMQLIVPNGQDTIILTLTCAKDSWTRYEKTFYDVISSFKVN